MQDSLLTVIGLSMIAFANIVGGNDNISKDNAGITEEQTEVSDYNYEKKILFVSESMEELFFSGASEVLTLLTNEIGSNLDNFKEAVPNNSYLQRHLRNIIVENGRAMLNISKVHSRLTRQVRKFVVRCCGSSSCSYSSRQNQRRTGFGNGYGFGNNGMGGFSPWNGFQSNSNVNRGSQGFASKAIAMVLPSGVSISCPGCAPGWQQNLNFGHGVGFIPITCPGCPAGWQQMLNMGPGVEFEEETTTVTTTTTVATTVETTTEETTTEETTTEETTTEETTTEAGGTTAAKGGGLGDLIGGFLSG
ncbi:uncharacterized protein LOC135940729 [Cloeon dipterum]|uniref:uncharacterized protein LOC135940729 n=1 Tax=Cloeon dipterum TaxID=197152 RepID=UPI003220686A